MDFDEAVPNNIGRRRAVSFIFDHTDNKHWERWWIARLMLVHGQMEAAFVGFPFRLVHYYSQFHICCCLRFRAGPFGLLAGLLGLWWFRGRLNRSWQDIIGTQKFSAIPFGLCFKLLIGNFIGTFRKRQSGVFDLELVRHRGKSTEWLTRRFLFFDWRLLSADQSGQDVNQDDQYAD